MGSFYNDGDDSDAVVEVLFFGRLTVTKFCHDGDDYNYCVQ